MKNKFKIVSVEVITGQKNDLLYIKYKSSHGYDCELIYEFNDGKRHKRSFNQWLKNNSTDFLMYNIKNKWSKHLTKCRCWHRSDGQLMFERPLV